MATFLRLSKKEFSLRARSDQRPCLWNLPPLKRRAKHLLLDIRSRYRPCKEKITPHYLREVDTGLTKKRLPHTTYAIRCGRGTSVRCTAARARNLQFKKPVDTGLARKRLLHTTYARSIPALKRKDYRTLPTRFGVPAAPRFGARRPAPGICSLRNRSIPALQGKDYSTLPTRGRYRPYKEKTTAHYLRDSVWPAPPRFAARRHAPHTSFFRWSES